MKITVPKLPITTLLDEKIEKVGEKIYRVKTFEERKEVDATDYDDAITVKQAEIADLEAQRTEVETLAIAPR